MGQSMTNWQDIRGVKEVPGKDFRLGVFTEGAGSYNLSGEHCYQRGREKLLIPSRMKRKFRARASGKERKLQGREFHLDFYKNENFGILQGE